MILRDLLEGKLNVLHAVAPYAGRPNIFVSFTEINKLGINPQPKDTTTPAGIYCYPLTSRFYEDMQNNNIPYGMFREYVYLFEGRGNIINLGDYTENDLDDDLVKLIDHWRLFAPNIDMAAGMVHNYTLDTPLGQQSPGAKFWTAIKRCSMRIGFETGREHHAVWNGLLRRIGYDGIVDPGMGIIHKLEPMQAIFLAKSACNVIMALDNDLWK